MFFFQQPSETHSWLGLTQPWATLLAALAVLASAAITFWIASLARSQREKHWKTENHQSRFTNVAAQLADASPAVRIAGVYAMETLVNDLLNPTVVFDSSLFKRVRKVGFAFSEGDIRSAQTCVSVLCAYLRLAPNAPPDRDPSLRKRVVISGQIGTPEAPSEQVETHYEYIYDDAEVRATILRVISAHMRYPQVGTPWTMFDYDFTGAELHDVDFSNAIFEGEKVDFSGVKFFGNTSFARAHFKGAVSFSHATFNDDAYFFATQFVGETTFVGANFHDYATFALGLFAGKTQFGFATFHGRTAFDCGMFADHDDTYTSFEQVEFKGKEISFHSPILWNKVHFDWYEGSDTPMPGTSTVKPSHVAPDQWPPEPFNQAYWPFIGVVLRRKEETWLSISALVEAFAKQALNQTEIDQYVKREEERAPNGPEESIESPLGKSGSDDFVKRVTGGPRTKRKRKRRPRRSSKR